MFKFLANKVYNASSEDSLVTHYAIYKFKQKYERNIFLYKGHSTPVPIADKVNSKYYEYEGDHSRHGRCWVFNFHCPVEIYIKEVLFPFFARIRWDVQSFGDNNAIQLADMNELYLYLQNKNFTNITEAISYFNDKGIATGGEFDEEITKNGSVYFPVFHWDSQENTCYWEDFNEKHTLLHVGLTTFYMDNDTTKGYSLRRVVSDLYTVIVYFDYDSEYFILDGIPSPTTLYAFDRAEDLIIPPTADEIMELINSTNITRGKTLIIDKNETFDNSTLENDENVRAIVLGFNDISIKSKNISYYNMYFTTLNKNFISNFMKMPIHFKYKNTLRNLENEDDNYILSFCFITKDYNKYKASCPVIDNNTENIDSLEIIPNFTFVGDKNVTVSFSPIANKQKCNIVNTNNNIDYSNYTLYALENSSYVKNEKGSFNISGIISNFSNNYTDDTYTFILNNNNNDDTSSEIKCNLWGLLQQMIIIL